MNAVTDYVDISIKRINQRQCLALVQHELFHNKVRLVDPYRYIVKYGILSKVFFSIVVVGVAVFVVVVVVVVGVVVGFVVVGIFILFLQV